MTDIIDKIGALVAGLSVPVSMGMPLGVAKEAWSDIRDDLNLFGWNTAEEVADALRAHLETRTPMTDQSPEANLSDTDDVADLRARVEALMKEGRIRNAEGERIAALPETAQQRIAEALARHPLTDDTVLVLNDDHSVTWEGQE